MLRAVHVIGRMPGHGTQRQLAEMLKVAHGRFWDARLAVLRAGDPLTQEVADAGVPVVQFAGPDWDPRRFTWLRRAIDGADVVHSSLWGANAFCADRRRSRRPRPAVVVTERSVEISVLRPPGRSIRHPRVDGRIRRQLSRRVQRSSPGAIGADRAGRRDHQRDR